MFDGGGLSLDAVGAFIEARIASTGSGWWRSAGTRSGTGAIPRRTRRRGCGRGSWWGGWGRRGCSTRSGTATCAAAWWRGEVLGWWSPLADAVFALQALSATPGLIRGGGSRGVGGTRADGRGNGRVRHDGVGGRVRRGLDDDHGGAGRGGVSPERRQDFHLERGDRGLLRGLRIDRPGGGDLGDLVFRGSRRRRGGSSSRGRW